MTASTKRLSNPRAEAQAVNYELVRDLLLQRCRRVELAEMERVWEAQVYATLPNEAVTSWLLGIVTAVVADADKLPLRFVG